MSLSRSGLETLACIDAAGVSFYAPGDPPVVILNDVTRRRLHSTTIANLIRDGYLEADSDWNLSLSAEGLAAVNSNPKVRGIAVTFYEGQMMLAATGRRGARSTPDFSL